MNYKHFSKVEEALSVIGLGTWQFAGAGDWPEFNKEDAIRIIHEAIDSGINFIDTAPVYGLGHSEKVVGEAIKNKRDQVFLATKCGLVWDDQNRVTNNLKADSLNEEIDASLKRLHVDHIDLYQIHWPDPNTDIRETMEALRSIQEQGKIKYIGVSNFSEEMMKEAMTIADVVSHQGLYNMLEQNATSYHNIPLQYRVKDSLLNFLDNNGQFFLPYSPLMQGLLAGKTEFDKGAVSSNPELQNGQLDKHLETIKGIGTIIDKPIHEIALNWLVSQKTVGPVIAGCTKSRHLHSNLSALNWTMDEEMMNELNNLI
ncbi:aldo/keto reductase [Vallitalea okinawensis]|uniref:aldo/keto reductase n=1 Tax=Vallitalea okinawensis TaxID=2078660 RepID=UPI000CFC5E40|nr:aldo/keto reductase [Vallitalea okinawensis]